MLCALAGFEYFCAALVGFKNSLNFPKYFPLTHRTAEFAGLGVEGCALLDGAEAGDAEGLTGLGDGCGPAADVLECALAVGMKLLGDESAVLVDHEVALGQARFVLQARTVPDLAAASTDANTTGHFRG